MGKRKDKCKDKDELEEYSASNKKKQKKHKKHRKKRSHSTFSDTEEIDVVNDDSAVASQDDGKSLFKLKIKFGGRTLSTTNVVSDTATEEFEDDNTEDDDIEEDLNVSNIPNEEVARMSKRDASKEEDAWLDALEKGELDDAGGLKREKDKSLMTARQRALRGEQKDNENALVQLPMYPERTEEDNEEFERKRQVRAKKRRQQLQKQIEETKTQTIEKLLTKGQKIKKDGSKAWQKEMCSHVRYTDNVNGISLSYTEGLDYPLKKQSIGKKPTPAIVKCSVTGCNNIKKYSCVNTKLPICSLQCYKTVNEQPA